VFGLDTPPLGLVGLVDLFVVARTVLLGGGGH
jgi:hypothetical protein